MESFGSDFSAAVLMSLAVGHGAAAFGRKGIVTGNHHLAAFRHGTFVADHFHGSYHGLAGETETARRTVVEHVPLSVDLFHTAVSVVSGIGGDDTGTVAVEFGSAGVDQHTAALPRTEGRIAVGIAQSRIAAAHAVVGTGIAAVDGHVLVADAADGRGLEEVERSQILARPDAGIGHVGWRSSP